MFTLAEVVLIPVIASAFATIVMVSTCPLIRSPTVQLGAVQEPILVLTLVIVKPLGITSEILTFVAAFTPLLSTVILKVMVSSSRISVLSAVLVTTISGLQ